jgi:hypothetical protein
VWSSKDRETRLKSRGYFCVLMNKVGVRLSSPLSDTSRPEGAAGGIWGGGGGVNRTVKKSFPFIVGGLHQ